MAAYGAHDFSDAHTTREGQAGRGRLNHDNLMTWCREAD
jgi:hypothetical protein